MEKFLDKIKNRQLLILGLGKEGQSTYRLLRKVFPEKMLGVADGNPKVKELLLDDSLIRFHLGKDYLQSIKKYDLIFKSPGISLKDVKCSNREKITSQADIFMQYYGKQTIGVTGTKGKSTTSSLIAHILKKNGRDVILLGNIGIPAFDKLAEIKKNTIVVFELSAHQLEYIHHSPRVAILLNIFPEHLDHFKSYEAYRMAKLNIVAFQQAESLLITTRVLSRDVLEGKPKIEFFEKGNNPNPDKVQLKGVHNLNNVKAAVLAVSPFGINEADALNAASSFKPLPHRMEYVGQFGGIHFYNDSISTIPESAMAAVKAIGDINTIILGGFDRGLDYSELLAFLEESNIKNILFTGPAGRKMFNLFSKIKHSNKQLFLIDGLEEAFDIIKTYTEKDGICLLSPAAASYDRFHNFEHRGDVFKLLAKKLQ